jgi:hypothetical protein
MPIDAPIKLPGEKPRTSMMPRRKIIVWAAVVVLVIAVGAGIAFVNSVLSVAKHAEFALHGTTIVIMATEKYVHEYGKWPATWKDLESVSLDPGGTFSWPNDLKELQDIQEFVEVDFSVTLQQVASQRVDNFSAIKPHGPAYGGWQAGIPSLLKTVQDTIVNRRNGNKAKD